MSTNPTARITLQPPGPGSNLGVPLASAAQTQTSDNNIPLAELAEPVDVVSLRETTDDQRIRPQSQYIEGLMKAKHLDTQALTDYLKSLNSNRLQAFGQVLDDEEGGNNASRGDLHNDYPWIIRKTFLFGYGRKLKKERDKLEEIRVAYRDELRERELRSAIQ